MKVAKGKGELAWSASPERQFGVFRPVVFAKMAWACREPAHRPTVPHRTAHPPSAPLRCAAGRSLRAAPGPPLHSRGAPVGSAFLPRTRSAWEAARCYAPPKGKPIHRQPHSSSTSHPAYPGSGPLRRAAEVTRSGGTACPPQTNSGPTDRSQGVLRTPAPGHAGDPWPRPPRLNGAPPRPNRNAQAQARHLHPGPVPVQHTGLPLLLQS